ncbi:MAG TPA: hypothetical protein VG245_01440 [Candidatus Dormibacteraeota bacterium]|nr:hypothetical protein [Candidatus Dormibacteraeota bacterium]
MACFPLLALVAMAGLVAGVAVAGDLHGLTGRLLARLPDGAGLPLRLGAAAIAGVSLVGLIELRAPC